MLERFWAFLAHDDEPEPQSRDRKLQNQFATSITTDRVQAPSNISTWLDAYKQSPLINAPVRKFAADVTAPGYRIDVADDSDLDEELEAWAAEAAIINGDLDGRDFGEILRTALIDAYGRRGTAMTEWVYDDAEAQETLMGLRPFRTETVTAYTRPGKNILLQPDDGNRDFEAATPRRSGATPDPDARTDRPRTVAGDTAAFVQFDDIFGTSERDEVPLAADDVTRVVHDPDTGDIFGRPATAQVASRALEIETKLQDADQGIKAKAYKLWLVQLEGVSKSEADSYVSDLALDDPTEKSVTNQPLDVETIEGEVPDIVEHLQFEVEYVLSALPVPLYKTGFAGDINRDVTDEQGDSYEEDVRDERRRLEARFEPVFQAKAEELTAGDAPEVTLSIEPDTDDSPLADETFDASEFASVMDGLATAAGPAGGATSILNAETIVDVFLGLNPDEVLTSGGQIDGGAAADQLDEADAAVRETFEQHFDADLGTRYSEGDVVQTPQGLGVVTEVRTESFEGKDGDEVDASSDSPTYIVGLKDARVGVGFYSASQLSATEMPETDVADPVGTLKEGEQNALLSPAPDAALADSRFEFPDSWQKAEKPARLILLDAWASLGGQFDCGGSCCMGEFNDAEFCASMKDRVMGGWEGWRKGG